MLIQKIDHWIKRFRKRVPVAPESSDSLISVLVKQWPDWVKSIRAAKGQRVLIATSMANYNHAAVVERALAVALTLRGAQVEFLLCDSVLPACQMTKLHGCEPEKLLQRKDTPRCANCLDEAAKLFDPLGLPIHRFSEYLTELDLLQASDTADHIPLTEIPGFKPDGLAIGEHAYAGALRYYGRGDLSGEPFGEPILRRFLKSALLAATVMKEALHRERYDVVLFHHGIYTPQGIIGEVCRNRGVRVVNWNPSYRKNTFIFSHDDTYHHTMITEPVATWQSLALTPSMEKTISGYLDSRRDGSADWIWFHEHPENDADALAREFGIDWSKPCIGLLTSVMWDAQLHYKSNAFPNMLAWIAHTIEYFRARPELQLLIRVHPAEVRGMVPSRQKVVDELRRLVPEIPGNVFVVPPEHQASTYALMDRCDSVLIFNTKTGIELSAIGKPVVVAGEAWIRGKGFAMDASSPAEYDLILDKLPVGEPLTPEQTAAAKRYAYHFFFRRMIELPFIASPEKYSFSIDAENLEAFQVEKWDGLDVICDGILHGKPFLARLQNFGYLPLDTATLSIIICSHNRRDLLRECLQSIADQFSEIEAGRIEVVVVDNCSEDGTDDFLKYLAKEVKWLRFVRENNLGLSYARNCGANFAHGNYLCYLDDDAKIGEGYLKSIFQVIDEHQPDILGGPVYPFYTTTKPFWFQDALEIRKYANRSGFSDCSISGGNFTIRADLLKQLGMFSTEYGLIGKELRLGEERELLERYQMSTPSAEQRSYYSLECFIYHHVPAKKMTLGYFTRRAFESGRMKAMLSNAFCDIKSRNRDMNMKPSLTDSLRHVIFGKNGIFLPIRVLHRLAFIFGILVQKTVGQNAKGNR